MHPSGGPQALEQMIRARGGLGDAEGPSCPRREGPLAAFGVLLAHDCWCPHSRGPCLRAGRGVGDNSGVPPEGPDKVRGLENQSQVWAGAAFDRSAAAVSPALGVSEAVSPGGPGGSGLGKGVGAVLGRVPGAKGMSPGLRRLSVRPGSVSPEDPGEGGLRRARAVGCCGGEARVGGGGLAGLDGSPRAIGGNSAFSRQDRPRPHCRARKALRGPAVPPAPPRFSSSVPASAASPIHDIHVPPLRGGHLAPSSRQGRRCLPTGPAYPPRQGPGLLRLALLRLPGPAPISA